MHFTRAIAHVFFLTTLALTTLALAPFAAGAADTKISSYELVTQGSTTQGATTDYTFAIEFSALVPSGTTVSVLTNVSGADSMDMTQVLDFSDATVTSSTMTFTGSTSSMGSGVYELFLTADAAAGKHMISATGVVNPSVDVCLFPAATTGSLPGDVVTAENGLTIGGGSCSGAGDGSGDAPSDGGLAVTVLGNNLVVQWDSYSGVATYGLVLDTDDNLENGNVNSISGLTDTRYVWSDLSADTTYYVAVNGVDVDGNSVVVPYATVSETTEGALDSRVPSTLTVKKIKSTQARAQWEAYSEVEQTYLNKLVVRIQKGKKHVQKVSVVPSKTKKKFKKLKPETTYTVQLKEVWEINDAITNSQWSVAKTFTTKKK